ncbi:MlaD family protein [Conexibacter sp. SYSU D00693]|uniref:MlaD family protein n=1 Tax=Conexibacter sp. SYSU D00693 TaxID=2812560 RepID=UPI00196BACD8|nr:MlaD family protein [Conexibacter sp. SYSU D00693]
MSPIGALKARFEQVPGQHRPHPIRNGAIFLGLLALILYCGFTKSIPLLPDGGTELKAHFDNAVNANTGNQVRVRGVEVGSIKKIERDPSGEGALITMRIDEDGFKVKQDAKAAIYWRTLLGRNMYVELDPGSPSAPDLDGDTIPLKNTQTQVEFDQLLDSYDEDGRRGVRTFFQQTDQAFGGEDAGAAIGELGPGLTPVPAAMRALRGTKPGQDLPTLVRTGAKALDALGRREDQLAGLLDGASTTFGVLAARSADLDAILDESPAAMRDTQLTTARLNRTLDVLDPVAEQLRPGVRKLDDASPPARAALAEVNRLTPTALPSLRDLRPALADLQGAAEQGTPFLRDLQPTLERLRDQIIPFLDKRDSTTNLRNVEAIGPFFSVLADSSKQFDGYGHVQRFQAGQGERSLGFLPCNTGLFDPENPQQAIFCKEAITAANRLLRGGKTNGGVSDAAARLAKGGR